MAKKMVVTSENILANAAKNIVMNRLRSKLLKKFRQEDDNDDNVNMTDSENYDNDNDDNDDDDNRPDLGFSSRLNFPKW